MIALWRAPAAPGTMCRASRRTGSLPTWRRCLADELLSLLRRELADAPLFAIKDPRLCRLVPLWLAVLPRLGVRAQFILPLRNPAEVAASLKVRNDFPLAKGYLVWLRNVLDAEQATRGQERVFVTYEELLQDWRGVVNRIGEALGMHWPRLSRTAEAEIEDFLSPELRRQRADWAEVRQRAEVPGWVVRAYDALLCLASSDPGDDPAAEAELDAVREELDRADATYGRALAGMGFRIDKGVAQAAGGRGRPGSGHGRAGRLQPGGGSRAGPASGGVGRAGRAVGRVETRTLSPGGPGARPHAVPTRLRRCP